MDKTIDPRFERLELALTSLINSVAKYSPLTAQAEELDNADKELCKGLEEGALISSTLSISGWPGYG